MSARRGLASLSAILRPLHEPIYRRIWFGSIFSNLGQLIGAVGAAWSMTQLTKDVSVVALVQTATMLPLMLGSIPAGAMADMFDRRKVALTGLSMSLVSAASLWLLVCLGLISPAILLVFCFLIGTGIAVFGPAWQSSVAEQVPAAILPQAIALNAISYNIARSFGPAIGGLVVAAAGAAAAFAVNTLFYVPLIVVLLLWRRVPPASVLPPERIDRAVRDGLRFVIHSPSIRVVMLRTFMMGIIGSPVSALMPLTARDLLGGGSSTFGIILGSFGLGAIVGALTISTVRQRLSGEAAARACAMLFGAMTMVVGLSGVIWITAPALFLAGVAWMIALATFNISIQTAAPRWVTGRVLATFQASITGGMALGSWLWGHVAAGEGLTVALLASGATMCFSPVISHWLRLPDPVKPLDEAMMTIEEVQTDLPLSLRSGPVVLEIEYRVARERARDFYRVMDSVQQSRRRNGCYGWSIARAISDAEIWVERFHFPAWLDYLRHRERATQADRELTTQAAAFHQGHAPPSTRRLLERPFDSVRRSEPAPDAQVDSTVILGVAPL